VNKSLTGSEEEGKKIRGAQRRSGGKSKERKLMKMEMEGTPSNLLP